MTWQGGKLQRELSPISEFGRLKAFAKDRDDPPAALKSLAGALGKFPKTLNLNVQLVSGGEDDAVEHWHVLGGAKGAKAARAQPKKPDVIVVLRPETLMEIAQGRLAPYEALYTGRLRVGGDLAAAQALVRHLTDPSATYKAPCRG
jgi:putative sterol carrier protein